MIIGNIDAKDDHRTYKAASLMGPRSGTPSVVDSSDGKLIRIRPFHYDEGRDISELNPWKITARGRTFAPPNRTLISSFFLSYKKRVYSENRVRYPLKRVDFDPKGERNPQNRGKSGYVRISWDEASQIVADELGRIKEKYGMSAVLSQADFHGEGKNLAPSHGCANRLLSLLGGYTTQMRNEDSWEGWYWGSKNVWGCEPVGEMMPSGNLFPDICENSELLLFWGCDPETTPLGIDGHMASRLCYHFTSLGIKSVYVDPALNYGAAVHADKWIPVLPNTDAALYLAIAWLWLTEGTYDKKYVKTHVLGSEPFFDYVLGKEDGIPKTPRWATSACGINEWTIKALARDWARKITSICIGNGGPGIRGPYATEPARLQSILLSMQGLGKPGRHQAKLIEWNLFSAKYPLPYQGKAIPTPPHFAEVVRPPGDTTGGRYTLLPFQAEMPELRAVCGPTGTPPHQFIPRCLVHEAILTGHAEWQGLYTFNGPADEQWEAHEYPAKGCSRIHMIWTDAPCNITCWNDGYRFIEAYRDPSIEFMVAQQPWMENDCLLADIVFPIATAFELTDISEDTAGGIYTSIYRQRPACPPVGESVSDFEAVARVAKKISDEVYNAYTHNEISDDALVELFFKGSGVAHLDENDDFRKKDMFVMPCDPDIREVPPGLRPFADDPVKNPLLTPTGKLEFTSTGLLKHFPDDQERPPYPKWIEKGPSHDEALSSDRAKKYPLLCMSNHGRWRMHAQCDDITWTREIETMKIRAEDGYQYEPAWLSPSEAMKRGIKHKDIVKVFNEKGAVLCAAYVTERLIDGVVYVDHGARFDPINDEVDRGGAINLITPRSITSKRATGMVVSGFLAEVAKVTGKEMEGWKKSHPEAFARKIDHAVGTCLEGWLRS